MFYLILYWSKSWKISPLACFSKRQGNRLQWVFILAPPVSLQLTEILWPAFNKFIFLGTDKPGARTWFGSILCELRNSHRESSCEWCVRKWPGETKQYWQWRWRNSDRRYCLLLVIKEAAKWLRIISKSRNIWVKVSHFSLTEWALLLSFISSHWTSVFSPFCCWCILTSCSSTPVSFLSLCLLAPSCVPPVPCMFWQPQSEAWVGTPGDTHCSEDPLHSPSPEGKGVICCLRSSSSDFIPTLRAAAAPTAPDWCYWTYAYSDVSGKDSFQGNCWVVPSL